MIPGFGLRDVKLCSERAETLADAIVDMLAARTALDKAQEDVPNYTAQYVHGDYYAEEQEAYNRACERLEEVVFGKGEES